MENNFIYSKLVDHNADYIGMVAYGLYKRHKIEFIESIREKYNRRPNDEEWAAFAITTNADSQLQKYISEAESGLADFVMETAGEQLKEAEKRMLESYRANIKAVLPSSWKTIGLSVMASLIFSAVISLAMFLGAFSEKGKSEMIDRMIGGRAAVVETIRQTSPTH